MEPIAIPWYTWVCGTGHYFHRWGVGACVPGSSCWLLPMVSQWSISSECEVSMFVGSGRTDHARARHLDTARPRARACARPAHRGCRRAGARGRGRGRRHGRGRSREAASRHDRQRHAMGLARGGRLVRSRIRKGSPRVFFLSPASRTFVLNPESRFSRPDARSPRGWQPGAAGDAGAARAKCNPCMRSRCARARVPGRFRTRDCCICASAYGVRWPAAGHQPQT